ncbi:MAG TPA: hypothetical protein VI875_02120 [Candidatus Norongarragalinales archaeon]|nr:hypothetical protein [Candidatus Norongarragalinales archaeon]
MLVPVLLPQFAAALAMSVLLFAMVFENNSNTRLLEALAVFVLFWASIAFYALAHKRVSKKSF